MNKKIKKEKVGPEISSSKSEDDKIRENIIVGDGTTPRKVRQNNILDTSPDPLIVDTSIKPDLLMTIESRLHPNIPSDTIVFSMRMDKDLLDHIKQVAREISFKTKKNIGYQTIINEAVMEKYGIKKEKKEKNE